MTLPIIKYRSVWFILSGILVAASVAALLRFPLRLGIDFTGGSLMEVAFSGERPSSQDLRSTLADIGYGDAVVQTTGDNGALMRMPDLSEETHQEVLATLEGRFEGLSEQRFESIGPSIGNELRRNAVWSLAMVLTAIALYVAYAFRKVSRPVSSWKYALATLIAALMHDVLIPLGVFAILGHYLLVELNSGFVAAMLTILGFSVHDTIVVFDRIRENLLRSGGKFEDVVERSVNETLARSLNTTITTLFPLFAIMLWGGETLKWFALALIIGMIAGTYSSICLASPLLVVFQKRSSR